MIDEAAVRDATEIRLRRAYGFDEVALVPGAVTADPAEVDLAVELGDFRLEIPFLAAAMDAVVDADMAVRLSRHGGVAFVNLEGLYTRYADAGPIIERVAAADDGRAAAPILADAYEQPIREDRGVEGPEIVGSPTSSSSSRRSAVPTTSRPRRASSRWPTSPAR